MVSYCGNLKRFMHVEALGNRALEPAASPTWCVGTFCMQKGGLSTAKPKSGWREHEVTNLRSDA